MRPPGLILCVFSLSLITAPACGWDAPVNDSAITMTGVIDFSMGEVVRGMYRAIRSNGDDVVRYPSTVSHLWFGQPLARLTVEGRVSEKIRALFGFEVNVFLNTYPPYLKTSLSSNGWPPVLPQYMSGRLHQAQGIFSLVDKDQTSLNFMVGLMPYKYNPEVRNLGEFLFRSGTYPFFLINDFNFPLARLSGLRLNFVHNGERFGVRFDQFILTEREMPPMNDISLATVVNVTLYNIIDIGFGVDFARVITLNDNLTTPASAVFEQSPGDTGRYTFRGTKLMARGTVDPFGRVRGTGSFLGDLAGEHGGKLYGEVAVVGLKNYPESTILFEQDRLNPWGYKKISERMPWMVGVNIPLWKILDVCAFELEKYPAPYPNDYYQVFMNWGLPIPTWIERYRSDTTMSDGSTWENPYDSTSYTGDRWYWSLYMKKRIARHISIIGQISRDHMRWEVNVGNKNNYATEEIMALPDQWSWRLATLFEF
ncbi:MAG: hypothetical protein JXA18_11905 [Chitinispirillaceae bacterium]|nr:hypothetical protein [Chitinispirillaceae bacterium]